LLELKEETTLLPFADRLDAAIRRCKNPVLVGLDPRAESLPERILPNRKGALEEEKAAAYRQFCRGVIDVVAPLVPAVKPQAAFFEQLGPAGMVALAEVIHYASQKGLLVILDGKRNDIGSTATAYALGMLGSGGQSPWGADALTVSPYLGDDSLQPFIDVAVQRAAGVFVLVKTSNPGGRMLQDLICLAGGKGDTKGDSPIFADTKIGTVPDTKIGTVPNKNGTVPSQPLYRYVADYVERQAAATAGACGYGVVGAVAGATYPAQLAELRAAMPHTLFLVPGFGSQGGTARDVAAAFDATGGGAVVNNSRGIIFAHGIKPYSERFGAERWQEAVEAATRDMIDQLRAETPAGKL
jgi:orotidine-5'-phosphate decarboxylase